MDNVKSLILHVLIFLLLSPGFAPFIQAESRSGIPDNLIGFQNNCRWLESMVRPVSFDDKTFALVQSYENLDDRCWIYDQALAVMCFTAIGRTDLSKQILTTLHRIQNPDGGFFFSYKISTLEPTSDRMYTGSIAWVAMAINLYRVFTSDSSYNAMLWKIMTWLSRQQVIDKEHPAYGGVSLGVRDDAFSTEHNLDTFSAFSHYHNRYFRKAAGLVRAFIMKNLYRQEEKPHFITGFNDPSLYLDCQSWAVLALGSDYCPVLAFAEEQFRVENGSLAGRSGIRGFFETRADQAPVWSEGTEGMALAYDRCGDREKADRCHDQVKRMMGENGGVAYASENTRDFSTAPSVAGTAWFLFYEMKLNPFRPRRQTVKAVRAFMSRFHGQLFQADSGRNPVRQ